MNYLIAVSNGGMVENRSVSGVDRVVIEDGIYTLYDKENFVIFSAPSDSLVYLELE